MNTWIWETINTTGCGRPTSREGHSFLYHASSKQWVLFGGFGASRNSDALILDTSTGQWENLSTTKVPLERAYHVAWIDCKDNRLYIFGGQGAKREPMYDMHSLCLKTGTWTKLGPAERPSGRIHSSGCLLNNRLFLFGGSSAPSDTLNNDLWSFPYTEINWKLTVKDGQCVGWALHPTTSPPQKRKGHSMNTDGCSLYIFGGFNGISYLNDLSILRPPSFTFTYPHTFGPSPTPRAYHACTVTSSNKMIIFGGKSHGDSAHSELLCDIYVLDLADLYWSTPFIAGFYPSPRYGAGLASGKNINNFEQILIIGGIGRTYAGMDLFSLGERTTDSHTHWHLEDMQSGKNKYQAATESMLLSNRRKIRDLEGQIYTLHDKSSCLEDEICLLQAKLEMEVMVNSDTVVMYKRLSAGLRDGIRGVREGIKKCSKEVERQEGKIRLVEGKVNQLERNFKETESYLATLDCAFIDIISINTREEFLKLPQDRLDEIAESRKAHQIALSSFKDWYQTSLDQEFSF